MEKHKECRRKHFCASRPTLQRDMCNFHRFGVEDFLGWDKNQHFIEEAWLAFSQAHWEKKSAFQSKQEGGEKIGGLTSTPSKLRKLGCLEHDPSAQMMKTDGKWLPPLPPQQNSLNAVISWRMEVSLSAYGCICHPVFGDLLKAHSSMQSDQQWDSY